MDPPRQPYPNTAQSPGTGTSGAHRAPPPSPPPFLEIPIFGRPSLLRAIGAGAGRIELNAAGSYAVGGTTPGVALVRQVCADLDSLDVSIPLRVMIRPRGRDFYYDDREKGTIRTSIGELKNLLRQERGDGFVFGALKPKKPEEGDGTWFDAALCKEVVGLAAPFPVVFHRAFDEAIGSDGGPQVEETARLVHLMGFKGLLTSGGVGNAKDNVAVLKRIIERVDGAVEIIVGGGVRSANVGAIREELNKVEGGIVVYHSSCLTAPDKSEDVDEEEVRRIVKVWDADEGAERTVRE